MGAEGREGEGMDGWERWMASWQRRLRRRLVSIVGMWSCKVSIISAGHDNLFYFVCLFVCDFFISFYLICV